MKLVRAGEHTGAKDDQEITIERVEHVFGIRFPRVVAEIAVPEWAAFTAGFESQYLEKRSRADCCLFEQFSRNDVDELLERRKLNVHLKPLSPGLWCRVCS